MKAADLLRIEVGQNNLLIEWVAVRPDTLINHHHVTEYKLFASPTRSAIVNAGTTSQINVENFMEKLLVDNALWKKWKGRIL